MEELGCPGAEPPDEELARRAVNGDRQALESLLRRHQRFLYDVALDAAASPRRRGCGPGGAGPDRHTALRLPGRGKLPDLGLPHRDEPPARRASQQARGGGDDVRLLRRVPGGGAGPEPPAAGASPEEQLLVEEARRACTLGMLLCLDRRQRLTFILGEILEVGEELGAAALEVSRSNFRQLLARARRQLYGFMGGRCGPIASDNPCRCARKTRAFVRDRIGIRREWSSRARTWSERRRTRHAGTRRWRSWRRNLPRAPQLHPAGPGRTRPRRGRRRGPGRAARVDLDRRRTR